MSKSLRDLQLEFLNLRFGMFIHYNMSTFHGEEWAKPNHDPASFNPTSLDCDQWARAAVSAGMKYGVLTTKHHDGFCLWPTQTTKFSVASSPYRGDVVKEFADAFRRHGLKVGLYFSIMDFTHDINRGTITAEKIKLAKDQIRELLTGYGEVICLVFDGWNSPWGGPDYKEVPYEEIYALIKGLQPSCLVINHDGIPNLSHSDVVHFEETYGQWCCPRNVVPSQQGPVLQGPDEEKDPQWFWKPYHTGAKCKSVGWVVREHLEYLNAQNCNLLLNCAPNPSGTMDANVVARLAEIGRAWRPPALLKALPSESGRPAPTAKASSVRGPEYAPANAVDGDPWTWWEPEEGVTKGWLEVDLGAEMRFNRVYLYQNMHWQRQDESMTDWEVSYKIPAGEWKSLHRGGFFGTRGLKAGQISFPTVAARHVRLDIHGAKVQFGIREFQVYHVNEV
jgi:alpha-L-fucosidase